MANETTKLLNAEAAVQELLTNLQRVKGEMESYNNAAISLGSARDGVLLLVSKMADLVEKTGGVVQSLSSIGTPEILARLADVSAAIELDTEARERQKGEIVEELNKQGQTSAVAVEELRKDLADSRQTLEQRVELVRKENRRRGRLTLFFVLVAVLLAAGAVALQIPMVP